MKSEKAEIHLVNSTKISWLANKFATNLKKYWFDVPEKDSISSIKEKTPKTKVLYLHNDQTWYGLDSNSKTLEALAQFLLVDPIKEQELEYSKNPGTKIEIVLWDDYKLFLNK